MAAQYLHQMYAAQQQHLMLQTAALQHQHSPHLQSLATIQQVRRCPLRGYRASVEYRLNRSCHLSNVLQASVSQRQSGGGVVHQPPGVPQNSVRTRVTILIDPNRPERGY